MSFEAKIREASPRHTALLHTLRETESAIPDLEAQSRYIADLVSQVRDANVRLKQLEATRKRELKEHESLRDSRVRRFAYKAARKTEKFDAKASKEEREYIEALQDEEDAAVLKANLDEVLGDAQQSHVALEARSSVHKDAQRKLDELYDSVFRNSADYAEEVSGRAELAFAANAYRDAQAKCEREAEAVQHLQEAQLRMNTASEAMDDALRRSRRDVYGGGTYTDMMEREALRQAERELHEAQQLVAQAQRASPLVHGLPHVAMAQGHVFGDMVFDNIFSDMHFHDRIKQSAAQVQGCAQALSVELQAAVHRRAELARQTELKKAAMHQAKANLQEARETIFEMFGGAPLAPDGPPPAGSPPVNGGGTGEDEWWQS